jgi:hypothetical protein
MNTPFKWRLMMRSNASFDVCSTREGQTLKATAADGTELPALPLNQRVKEHTLTTGLNLHCARLKADSAWGDDVRLNLPENAVALLSFRVF